MIQQPNLSNIIAKQNLQNQILGNIESLNAQKISPIQKRIQEVLTPSNIVFSNSYIDEQISQQQIRRFSLMNFFSQLYIQMMSQLILFSEKIDPKTGKPMMIEKQFVYEKIVRIINSKIQIIQKIGNILSIFKGKQLHAYYIQLIVKAILDHCQRFLRRANYSISPQIVLKVIFNPYCLKFEETDTQTMKLVQNKNVIKCLNDCSVNQTAPNVQFISKKLIQKMLKDKFPKSLPMTKMQKWGSVQPADFVDPKRQMIQKYHLQQSLLHAFLKTQQVAIDEKLKKIIEQNKNP